MDSNLVVEYGNIYKKQLAQEGDKYSNNQNPTYTTSSWLPQFNTSGGDSDTVPERPTELYQNQNDGFRGSDIDRGLDSEA